MIVLAGVDLVDFFAGRHRCAFVGFTQPTSIIEKPIIAIA